MVDLVAFKDELRLIVNGLANAIVTEMFTAAEKVSLNKQNPEAEERLSTLVDSMCVEAVDKLLKVVQLAAETAKGLFQRAEGENSGDGQPPTEQTYILVYGAAAVDSKCVQLPQQSKANANAGEEKTDATGEATILHSELVSPFPRPQADVPDHEYARPSSPLPASAVERSISKRGRKRQLRSKHEKVTNTPQTEETTETLSQCVQCGMLFPNAERLSDHQRKSHPVCSVCGKTFTGILKLHEHKMKEHGLLPYGCDYCPKRFNHKPHLNLHVKARHTGEKTCHCDICGKGYSSISVLKTHRITHFEKKFTCDVCGRSFYHACHLTRHKVVHQEVRPYKCSTCGKGFTQAANLHSHQVIHTGERQLCSICGKSYRCLKNHVISKHSHELPADELTVRDTVITCDVCGKKFPNLSQFKVHQRIHTGEKPFHCDICGKSYRLKELLRDHRYTHTGEKPYSCTHCSKTFNLATSFIRHRSIHTGETPYSCLECGKHFRLLTFLKAHQQTKAHLKQMQKKHNGTSDHKVIVS